MVTAAFVVLAIRIVVGLPAGEDGSTFVKLKQGSLLGSLELLAVVAVRVTSRVGNDAGVFVGGSVGLGVSVGGRGVEVGIAACVSATIVNAAATAVDCTSAGFIVGTGSAPHALISSAPTMTNEVKVKCFMVLNILLRQLTVGEAAALRNDTFVLYNNRPTALCDAEAAEHFEILRAIYKGSSTVLSNRAGRQVGKETTFSQFRHDPQG